MRKLLTLIISLIPFQAIKIWLYRMIFNYNINYNSHIGFFNVLECKLLKMESAKIGHFNFINCHSLKMEEGSIIKKFNRIKHINTMTLRKKAFIFSKNFIGGSRDIKNKPSQNIIIGDLSQVLRNNYFDVTDEIVIGNNVVFGGNGSEIWTHGFDIDRNLLKDKVSFGDNIFIGSKCIFTKGISIVSNTSFGSGSVIYKSINESGLYSSQQIRKIK